jgi:hypothetical protein
MPLSENEEFFHMHRDKFPEDFSASIDFVFELKEMFETTEPQFLQTIHPPLKELMLLQYPDFKSITDPVQKNHIRDINKLFSFFIIWHLCWFLHSRKKGQDLKIKYPQLEEWRKFYCHPATPEPISDSLRNHFLFPADKEWLQHKEEEKKNMLEFYNWEESRRQAFYDIVQPLLFETIPALHNLEGDEWVLYAMYLRDQYEEWKTFCEHLETVIDYELPPDSFYWEKPDFQKALHEKGREYLNRSIEKRNRRIHQQALN